MIAYASFRSKNMKLAQELVEYVNLKSSLSLIDAKACTNLLRAVDGQQNLQAIVVRLWKAALQHKVTLDTIAYTTFVSVCTSQLLFDLGVEIHKHLCANMTAKWDTILFNTLIHFYSEWNQTDSVVNLWHKLLETGQSPDKLTYHYALKACNTPNQLAFGCSLHKCATSQGLSTELTYALVAMYMHCGSPAAALALLNIETIGDNLILISLMIAVGQVKDTVTCQKIQAIIRHA
jgi:pentatricopeptide repeat protein